MDNLMEEGEAYAGKLAEAGIPTTLRRFEKSRHGFLVNLMDDWQEGEDYVVSRIKKWMA
jgi:acetyl esterase/lipase